MLMDMPPPIHGMSKINLAMYNKLLEKNVEVELINTAPSFFVKFFTSPVWVLIKCIYFPYLCLRLLMASFKHDCVYRPVNGGVGQIFDVVFIILCRLMRRKVLIHHHSFNYFNKKSKLFSCIVKLLPANAIHIVLGNKMNEKLTEMYDVRAEHVRVLSNAAFFEHCSEQPSVHENGESSQLTIGYLSNLSIEKGIDEFVLVCRQLFDQGVDFKAFVAGPYTNKETQLILEGAILDMPNITYLGAVYGKEKNDFYSCLDCFVFPSKYKNEAEPLVLYEAASKGGVLFGSRVGCAGDVIDALNGYSFNVSADLSSEISSKLVSLYHTNLYTLHEKNQRMKTYKNKIETALVSLNILIKEMEEIETKFS